MPALSRLFRLQMDIWLNKKQAGGMAVDPWGSQAECCIASHRPVMFLPKLPAGQPLENYWVLPPF